MGTNYYLRSNICKCCNRYEFIHIGKSSSGWKFLFHTDETHKNSQDWINEILLPENEIFNEYGEQQNPFDFIKLIKSKCNEKSQSAYRDITTDGMFDYLSCDFS